MPRPFAPLLCRVLLLLALLLAAAAPVRAASYTADASAINQTLYPWIDVSSGTTVSLPDDGHSGAIGLGFTFTLGSTPYTTVSIGSNGLLQFEGTSDQDTNAPLPLDGSSGRPSINAVLLPMWDDFDDGIGGAWVRYKVTGTAPNRVFTVTWNAVAYRCSYVVFNSLTCNLSGHAVSLSLFLKTATFQVQIHERGEIVYRYGATDGEGGGHSSSDFRNPSGATIGLEVGNTDYTLFSRNQATVPDGTTVVFTKAATPTAVYTFNESAWNGTSGQVVDSSGNGYNATAAGLGGTTATTRASAPAVSGATGTCGYGQFDRSQKQYVALPSGFPNLGASTSFTVTMWFRTTDVNQTRQRLWADDENNTGGFALSISDSTVGQLKLVTRGVAAASVSTPTVIASNTWYFVAFGVNTSTQMRFIHVWNASGGVLASVAVGYSGTGIGSDAGIATIGGESNAATAGENTSSYGFSGQIDEVRVYPQAMSPAGALAVKALTSTCPSYLLGRWRMEDASWTGAANELADSAGYGGGPYHGRAQGSPLPTLVSTSPARTGTIGTCGYANLPGPNGNGGTLVVNNLPVNTGSGAKSTLAFWMYWSGTDENIVIGFGTYDLWLWSGSFGFNTNNSDIYGVASTGLSGGWHHVVAVFTNGSVTANKLYIDGVAKTMTQRTGTPNLPNAVAASSLTIGGYGHDTGHRFVGRVDEVHLYDGEISAAQVTTLYNATHTCSGNTLHHVELRHGSGQGLTCTPSTLTVLACQDADCTTPYTSGVTGTLTASGAGMSVNWPAGATFAIGAGTSSTTISLHQTTAGSITLGASGVSPAPTNAVDCDFGSPVCSFSAAATGFLLSVPAHAAESTQSVLLQAVKSSDDSAVCLPAFQSVSRSVTLSCSYANPASGSVPVRVNGQALNASGSAAAACDAGGRALSLAFDDAGATLLSLLYADVGQLTLTARHTGSGSSAGLVMTGSSSFVAAPASFDFSGTTAGPIRAGVAFNTTVTARNAAGGATPNFGHESPAESVVLAVTRAAPTGAGAVDGAFSGTLGAFSAGVASSTNLRYGEVGRIDLQASLASGSYLGSGLSATGSTGTAGAVGRFTPDHFDLTATPACGSFTYGGQPFAMALVARNASGTTTLNYDGSGAVSPAQATAVTLAEPTPLGGGTWSGTSLAASAFTAGSASASPAFAFTSKLTAARSPTLRATDADGISSATGTEPSLPLRSGRLRLSTAFGKSSAALGLAVQAEYWDGSTWLLNAADSCTALPAGSVALSNGRNALGSASSATTSASALVLAGGQGQITLAAPSPAGVTVGWDVALNLGVSSSDQSCNASHPTSTGAGLPWLRSRNGSCSAAWDRDPSARASFGVYSGETRKTVHTREQY